MEIDQKISNYDSQWRAFLTINVKITKNGVPTPSFNLDPSYQIN